MLFITQRAPKLAAAVGGLGLFTLVGCGAKEDGATATVHEAVSSGSRLFYTPFAESSPAYQSSEVDDAENTIVLARFKGSIEAPPGSQLVEWNAQGTVTKLAVVEADREALDAVRVRGSVIAVGGQFGGPGFDMPRDFVPYQVLVYAFGTDGTQIFRWTGPESASSALVDVCPDGSIAVVADAGADSSGSAIVARVDATGQPVWQTTLANASPVKVRCGGNGNVYLTGATTDRSANVVAARYAADGTLRWGWTSTAGGASPSTFDLDDSGDLFIAGTYAAAAGSSAFQEYALSADGSLRWSWTSDGTNDSSASLSIDDAGNSALAGARGARGTRRFYVVKLDPGGNVLFAKEDPVVSGADAYATGVSIDDDGNLFVCGVAGAGQAVLYGTDGSTLWNVSQNGFTPRTADVTHGDGRCIGDATSPMSVDVLALQAD